MRNEIYIIIVTYNAMQWLPKCLESTKLYPVIIVDNNSQDDTVDYIEKEHPEITLFKQQKNIGFGQANNFGISHALQQGADYVFLLNQDAYLQKCCIENLVSVHQRNQDYGIISPVHLNGTGDLLDFKFSHYVNYLGNKYFYSDFILKKQLKLVYEIPFVNAAGWLISKNCLLDIGGFDPLFFHYGEDDNYCQRVSYHGYKIGVVPTVFLLHDRDEKKYSPPKRNDILYYENLERRFKIKYANINKPFSLEVKKLIKQQRRAKIKSFLKLNIQAGRHFKEEEKILMNLIPQIRRSRKKNKIKGSHYLNP